MPSRLCDLIDSQFLGLEADRSVEALKFGIPEALAQEVFENGASLSEGSEGIEVAVDWRRVLHDVYPFLLESCE